MGLDHGVEIAPALTVVERREKLGGGCAAAEESTLWTLGRDVV